MLTTVIGTTPDRADWAALALSRVPGDALVVAVPGFELGKLSWVVDNTSLSRFLFIQDSVLVSEALYGVLSNFSGSVALLGDPVPFGCYVGVYEADLLKQVGLPSISSKREAVEAETWWTQKYVQAAGDVPVLFPELRDETGRYGVQMFGRENLVLENDYITKYKGTWRYDQIID